MKKKTEGIVRRQVATGGLKKMDAQEAVGALKIAYRKKNLVIKKAAKLADWAIGILVSTSKNQQFMIVLYNMTICTADQKEISQSGVGLNLERLGDHGES